MRGLRGHAEEAQDSRARRSVQREPLFMRRLPAGVRRVHRAATHQLRHRTREVRAEHHETRTGTPHGRRGE